MRRFANGHRRGKFNRIVAHTVILPVDVLESVRFDPWLLLGVGRFRILGFGHVGPTWSLADLGAHVLKTRGDALPDLQCIPPMDPYAERLSQMRRRAEFLKQRWSYRTLKGLTVAVLREFRANRTVLIPERAECEQFLAWIWSALPEADRRRLAWTTHLAPSGAELFRLALIPSEEIMSGKSEQYGNWLILSPDRLPAEVCSESSTLSSFASVIIDGQPEWGIIEQALEDRGWSLDMLHNNPRLQEWIRRRSSLSVLQGLTEVTRQAC